MWFIMVLMVIMCNWIYWNFKSLFFQWNVSMVCTYLAGKRVCEHLRSGPMSECLRSIALACALVRPVVDSPLTAIIPSPTASLPSIPIDPPWTTDRIIMPEPSLKALTVIPARTRTQTHVMHTWSPGHFNGKYQHKVCVCVLHFWKCPHKYSKTPWSWFS